MSYLAWKIDPMLIKLFPESHLSHVRNARLLWLSIKILSVHSDVQFMDLIVICFFWNLFLGLNQPHPRSTKLMNLLKA